MVVVVVSFVLLASFRFARVGDRVQTFSRSRSVFLG